MISGAGEISSLSKPTEGKQNCFSQDAVMFHGSQERPLYYISFMKKKRDKLWECKNFGILS